MIEKINIDHLEDVIAETQLKHFNNCTMPAKKYCESHKVIAEAVKHALINQEGE